MIKKSLLIHGAYCGNIIEKIYISLKRTSVKIDEFIFTVYNNDKEDYEKLIYSYFPKDKTKIVYIKDLFNPGFANINRQIVSVREGLKVIDDNAFVIKLRNDQSINFDKLSSMIGDLNVFCTHEKILTTNCYTRKDRLYHPSDMFLCAKAYVLKKYYSAPLSPYTELEIIMQIKERMEKEILTYNPFSPESYLFRHYLENNNWSIKETYQDSYDALKKYIFLVNSWDIDLRWKKKRMFPFKKENQLILPHYFTLAPFQGGPIERVRCFSRHNFTHIKSLKDYYYLRKSKHIWRYWDCNLEGKKMEKNTTKTELKKHFRVFIKPLLLIIKYFNKIFKFIVWPFMVFGKWLFEIIYILKYLIKYLGCKI